MTLPPPLQHGSASLRWNHPDRCSRPPGVSPMMQIIYPAIILCPLFAPSPSLAELPNHQADTTSPHSSLLPPSLASASPLPPLGRWPSRSSPYRLATAQNPVRTPLLKAQELPTPEEVDLLLWIAIGWEGPVAVCEAEQQMCACRRLVLAETLVLRPEKAARGCADAD